jgi:hypothetical protein
LLRDAAHARLRAAGVEATEVDARAWQGGETSDLSTPSLWGDRRALLILGAQGLPDHGVRELEAYLGAPAPDAVMIVTALADPEPRPRMIDRCLVAAFEAFGGLPQAVLTDRMKTVLLDMDTGVPHWHPRFQDLMSALGISPRVCKPYTPQTKGKVERSIGVVKQDFWPGVRFTDLDDLNEQARVWCLARNARVHATTHERPVERWAHEGLRPLPTGWAWERFTAEERQVSWEGFVSFDGVLYGLPSRPGEPSLAGRRVQVNDRHGLVTVWSQGQVVLRVASRRQSGTVVPHPDQFRAVLPAGAALRVHTPLGHQIPAPEVAQRALAEYDAFCGVAS